MKEDWLNKIHDRMTDFEIDEPEGLWNAIESKQVEIPATSKTRKRPLMIWVKRSIAAAAIIAVVLTLGIYLPESLRYVQETEPITKDIHNSIPDLKEISSKKSEVIIASNASPENLIAHNRLAERSKDITSSDNSSKAVEQPEIYDDKKSNGSEIQDEVEEKSEEKNESPEDNNHIKTEDFTRNTDFSYHSPIKTPKSRQHNVNVSVYSSGGTGSALNYSSKATSFAALGADNSSWEDSPMLGLLLFNKGQDTETDIKHRLPIRAGVSFTYNFNKRFGIETGLSYTYLISDIKSGSENHYYVGEQKLHYLGIPLNLKYRVFSWKRLELYASAGVLAEKCISAKLDKEFIIDNQKKSSESEDLSSKPMQWSVNAAAGVQCNLVSALSIFAEPGLSYYFDDGTTIQTIYKDKPLNFNFNLGLRFTFGK